MEIVKGVYQIKLPLTGVPVESVDDRIIKAKKEQLINVIEKDVVQSFPISYVNTYLVEGKTENLLIDTGWNTPAAFNALTGELKNYGFELKAITQIVITHIHPDHYGMSGKLKQLSGARLALSEVDAKFFDSRYLNMNPLLEEIRRFFLSSGVPPGEISKFGESSLPPREFVIPATPDIKLKSGKRVTIAPFNFKVISVLGHSPGHICLYEPKRKLLFTGDHILPEMIPHIGFHPQSGQDPLGDYFNSLDELKKLEVNLVFPGHGPAFSGMKQRIEQILQYHEQRKWDILGVLDGEGKTALQVAMAMRWMTDISPCDYTNLEVRQQRLCLMETLAHLQYLLKQGTIHRMQKDDVYYYRA
jgi:glyoxylase-like metal-dependent hydrolase (beta-lactamase superfamily II)